VRILLVSATAAEVAPLVDGLRRTGDSESNLSTYQCVGHDVELLVTGVGMVATSSWCSRVLARHHYDLALNVGVCGSFRPALAPGTVVHVISDRVADLGAEDGDGFLSVQELNLLGEDEFPYRGGRLVNARPPQNPVLEGLAPVQGITVNTVHGRDDSIARVTARYGPDVESMEGAAFMYACLIHGLPFAQLRAVSNMVERRHRAAWKLTEAIGHLADTTRRLLERA
jgi:futalosine hydrolase